MNRQSIEKPADCVYGVFTAFLHSVAVGVCQSDLSGLCSGVEAVSVIDGNLSHGIPVDADDTNCFFLRINYGQEQGICLSARIKVL